MIKTSKSEKVSEDFNKSLYSILLEYIPPKRNSPYLADIINVLMDALEEGETQVDIEEEEVIFSNLLSCPGWPQAHMKALEESGWLEGNEAPITIRENKISWRKWDNNMSKLIYELTKRSTSKIDIKNIDCSFNEYPIGNKDLNPDQREAVEAISKYGIILISGGPGTGKTSTLTSLLVRALWLNPMLRVGLGAPTGKATRRLKESIQEGLQVFSDSQKTISSKISCKTLHSWLLARPNGFGRTRSNPIPLDLLIIDEMSMVDIELMQGLLNAYPRKSQLVLVGDPEQLPPIGSGAVWHQLQGDHLRKKFGKSSIILKKVYRNKGELASLSLLLRNEGISVFWEALGHTHKNSNLSRYVFQANEIPNHVINKLKRQHLKLIQITKELHRTLKATSLHSKDFSIGAERLLNQASELLVLCPRYKGVWGVNQIHNTLLKNALKKGIEYWPEGTPVMCGENQPELGLANGDVGILIGRSKEQKIIFRAFSSEGDSFYQLIHPSRLKRIELALALTIHKAQGSEAKEVILLWPNMPNQPFISLNESPRRKIQEKRLLYTAITRAKEKIDLISR